VLSMTYCRPQKRPPAGLNKRDQELFLSEHPPSFYFVTACSNNVIRVWDAAKNFSFVGQIETDSLQTLVKWVPSCNLLFTSGSEKSLGALTGWDLHTFKVVVAVVILLWPRVAVALPCIERWSTDCGRVERAQRFDLRHCRSADSTVMCSCFAISASSRPELRSVSWMVRMLFSCSMDKTIKIWCYNNLCKFRYLRAFVCSVGLLVGWLFSIPSLSECVAIGSDEIKNQFSTARRLAYSKQYDVVVSAGFSCDAAVWNVMSRTLALQILGHRRPLVPTSVCLS
jgi:WD40 repeat protein